MAMQWRSSWMEAVVGGNRSNGGLPQWWSSLTEAALGWRDDDAMASSTMASLANGSNNDGGGHCQLCSSGWCHHHHPFIGIYGAGKDIIATATINCHFYQKQLLCC
jgi:hypothetical protein